MSEYNQFVLAVNKIFEITAKMKQGWNDSDNINIADAIEESKTTVVEASKIFNPQAGAVQTAAPVTESIIEETAEPQEVGALGE